MISLRRYLVIYSADENNSSVYLKESASMCGIWWLAIKYF